VYWESFDDLSKAINREKQLKRWRREKKDWLIARLNPQWKDLAEGWYETQGPSTAVIVHSVNDRPRSG
jgi:putative endonuclease